MSSALNDRALLAQIARGDEQSFKILYRTYQPGLYAYIRDLLKSEQMADEAVNDVFMKVWLAGTALLDIRSFDAWLFTVAKNYCLNVIRVVTTQPEFVDLLYVNCSEGGNADQRLLFNDLKSIFQQAIVRLPKKQRMIFERRYSGLSNQEIADELGISRKTVKEQVYRAQKFVRNFLKETIEILLIIIIRHLH